MTELELDEILTVRWPGVLRRVMGDARTEGFVRSFAQSIARHGKRPSWRPSIKQERIMRELISEFTSAPEPEVDLIERD